MWLFICVTQFLAMTTSVMLWWLLRPQSLLYKSMLCLSVFIISNAILIYGLSEFWGEQFRIYLMFSILQGFLIYAGVLTALVELVYCKLLKRDKRPVFTRLWFLLVYVAIVSSAVFNAYAPKVNYLTVHTSKPLKAPMRIALMSDTHLGRWFGNRQIDKLVKLIDGEQVDTVLIAGDIMDDNTAYYDKTGMHAHLAKLEAPLGVYAVLGNHDFMRQSAPIAEAVTRAGITVLDNQSVLLQRDKDDKGVWLVGRSDDVDRSRPSATELLAAVDTDQPVIFLEHRPTGIDEVSQLPVDVHLSGHTHGGQIFPLTLLLDWLTPLNHGAKQMKGTQFVVSSGYGFGSVPFRLGTRSEIWVITLNSASSAPKLDHPS